MVSNPSKKRDGRSNSAASRIRNNIEALGEHYWKPTDFPDSPPSAVMQTLSRLTRTGVLQRVRRGLYYHPRTTIFGQSLPSKDAVLALRLTKPLLPVGVTAANLLGFSTQNPGRREFATTASAVAIGDDTLHVTTRRPKAWDQLSAEDAALLDFIRSRGRNSELSEEQTTNRILTLLRTPERFARLVSVTATEPVRVSAILGAIGQEIDASPDLIEELRKGLKNSRSRFDFGALRSLKFAADWQAK
jgi:hypothetical protein